MKGLKKILALVLLVAVVATASIAGTLAYLTDRESKANVFTVGDVQIELNEEFEQGSQLVPGVTVEKEATVTNTGKNDAWVWMEIAVPTALSDEDNTILNLTTGEGDDWTKAAVTSTKTINGKEYVVYTLLHNEAVEPGVTTTEGLTAVTMNSHVDIDPEGNMYWVENGETVAMDWNVNTEGNPVVYVGAYAIQTEGFDTVEAAYAAYQAQWGDNGSEFDDLPIFDYSIPEAEIVNGVVTLEGDEVVMVTGDFDAPITVTGEGTLHLRNLSIETTDASAIVVEGTGVKVVAEGDVTLKATVNAIDVPAGAKLDLSGEQGTLTAIGGNGVDTANGGNGIGGAGEIYIHDVKSLTAEGYGKAGFGIGGTSTSITIEDTTIEYVKGGYVQAECLSDPKYGKSEPEGGAAIGSMTNGAVITLNNVVIEFAEGGSKSAGIGARYWTGVTVNITDCDIKDVRGGNASAGIGGSRVSSGAGAGESVTINIHDSKVNATGGQFGAGIGSGYNTHCAFLAETVIEINITGASEITAQGGKYGAGIGTGFHVAALTGKIENTVSVDAVSGEAVYKDTYTTAMGIGFGVVDMSREGKDCTSSFDNQGTLITLH